MTIQNYRGRTILSADIWVYDLARNAPSRITFEGLNVNPSWTPDGKRLIYASGPNALSATAVSGPADGAAPPTPLVSDGVRRMPYSLSPDGKFAIGHLSSISRTGNDFWVLPLADGLAAPGAKPQSFLNSRGVKSNAEFSPDSHWVAYQSNESGTTEVYVASYPKADQKFTISTGGGSNPRWSRSRRELFYRAFTKMIAVDVQTTPSFRAGAPKELFGGTYVLGFDVSPDGQRFLMIKPPSVQAMRADQLVVVVNWMDELRRRLPLH
jgi:dipeptidyl aminopeptidase/acylaminoacyl peptidase